jgi:biotin carboxylase
VTGKFPLAPPFRETGNFMPHPLDETEAGEVLRLATEAAVALGVRSGVLHVEIKLTPDGPRIIEVNGRVAGGAIDLIFARRNDHSLTQLAALAALGTPLDVVAEEPATWPGPFDYEFFAQPPMTAARLVSVRGSDGIIGTAGAETVAANRSPGDELDWRNGSQEYVLRVTGTAPDREAVAAVPDAILAVASITYE